MAKNTLEQTLASVENKLEKLEEKRRELETQIELKRAEVSHIKDSIEAMKELEAQLND